MTSLHRRLLGVTAALLCLVGAGVVLTRGQAPDEGPSTAPEVPAFSSPSLSPSLSPSSMRSPADLRADLAALERRREARVGLVAIDTATGDQVGYRADERFALASTGKVLLAALVLDQLSDDALERRLFWTESDLVDYSPVTELHVEDGMTVRQLVDAALTFSDNTAANVLFELVGGPDAVQDWLGGLGDTVTSVDRVEPELNDWRPGEVRDTSTPRALSRLVRDLAVGDVLDPSDRARLDDDLGDSLTGAGLVRAGVPEGWRVGDKSGTASYGTRNDVAVVHPPGRAPWVVVVMTSHAEAEADTDDVLVEQATRAVVEHWS